MSMKVRSNLAATDALHNLNKNNSDLAKAIKKVSTGMDFNSSGDNSSGYSISERMRVQIRALNQNIRNVQTGNSLISVAEGGIQSIIDNLRSMKEMCLNAMNDHNTDQDRATIQKEYDKRMELIQDIASETSYNGKLLLDGRYESPAAQKYTDPVQLPMDKDSNGALTVPLYNGMKTTTMSIEEVWVYRPSNRANWPSASSTSSTTPTGPASTASGLVQNTSVKNLAANFSAMAGTRSQGSMYVRAPVDATAQQSYYGGTTVKIDFSGAVRATDSSTPAVGDFDQQGFSILCGGCYQFLNFRFDASIANSASTYDNNPSTTNSQAKSYTIGIADVANVSDLEKALYDGIASAQANNTGGYHYGTTSGTSISVDTSHDVRIDTDGNGTYYFTKQSSPALGIYDASDDPTTPPAPAPTAPSEPYKKEGLVIHDCPKAGQHMKLYMNDMRLDALKLTGTGTRTRDYAALSLGYIDHAIGYALNEATRMGAYRSRLEMSEANLVTGSENTQGAESTLRDTDMAKAMTEYTKSNVLMQASQSMLAQANQSSSGVLGLLQ